MMNNKAIVLLSGGLDSCVCLDIIKKTFDITYALFFNYAQKAYKDEKEAAKAICEYYGIEFREINLLFLKEIADNSLTNPDKNDFNNLKSVWIANRNGLFLNIAACFCDKYDIPTIAFGANKEEGRDFPDNTKEFIEIAKDFFKYSTLAKPNVIAPVIEFDKIDIINYAIDNNVPLKLIKSCYQSKDKTNKKHCGKCMSCKLLYNAILKSKKPNLIEEIF